MHEMHWFIIVWTFLGIVALFLLLLDTILSIKMRRMVSECLQILTFIKVLREKDHETLGRIDKAAEKWQQAWATAEAGFMKAAESGVMKAIQEKLE